MRGATHVATAITSEQGPRHDMVGQTSCLRGWPPWAPPLLTAQSGWIARPGWVLWEVRARARR